jgi:hypothetical protein
MATSIAHADVKPIIGILAATATWDSELDTICTACGGAVDAAVGSTSLTANAALVKEAAILIAAGTGGLGMMNRPGYAEEVAVAGLTVGPLDKDGFVELVDLGWKMLAPFLADAWAKSLADVAESARQKILAEARDDDVSAQADAELAQIVGDAALVGSQKAKVDAEELEVDQKTALLTKEVLTEAERPDKVIADTALSTAMAADATARANLSAARLARMTAEETGITGTDSALESHENGPDATFPIDSVEYYNGSGS